MAANLEKERAHLSCSPSELHKILYGSVEEAEGFRKYQELIANDPILRYDPSDLGKGRGENIELMCKKVARYNEVVNFNNPDYMLRSMGQFHEQLPGTLHVGMFQTTINGLGSDKQIEKWIPPSQEFKVFGCYAQTELGHGSDVQGLETTATYDKNTEEFIIHSPTVTAAKWWIGDLGIFANHVVTHAQLTIDNKKLGVQTFIVPIRDMQTHEPLPGITVGDVGPKYGYNTKDNGFLRFDHVRIPRDYMLNRYSKVNKNGDFVKVGNDKIGYGTMLKVRNLIIKGAPIALAQALTVAIRYSIMRTQFKDDSGMAERAIFDYQLQQEKLIPLLAEAYCHQIVARKITDLNDENYRRVLKEDFSMLNDMHSILCATKAMVTWSSYYGIERARQSCGGHGYSDYSGLPIMLREYSPNPTFEGDNTVLLLQTARYLVKNYEKAVRTQKASPFVDYLINPDDYSESKSEITNIRDVFQAENIRKALRYGAYMRIQRAAMKLLEGTTKGANPKETWDKHAGIVLVEAAQAHFIFWAFKTFMEAIFHVHDERAKNLLNQLAVLYGVDWILKQGSILYETGYMTGESFKLLREAKEKLLEDLRPQALGLIEAFLINDNSLKTAIGRKDGKPYETLYDWAKNKNYLNKPGMHKKIRDTLLITKSPKL